MRWWRAAVVWLTMVMRGARLVDATCCSDCYRDYGYLSPYCASSKYCLGCDAGYYLDEEWCTCKICPAGSYCPDRKNVYQCYAGSAQGSTGATVCAECIAGVTYQDLAGQTACKACTAQQCGAGYRLYQCIGSRNTEGCGACLAGTYMGLSLHSQTACVQCEQGKYQSLRGQSACLPATVCPANQYLTAAATATTDTQCAACVCSGENYINCPINSAAQRCSPCTGGSSAPAFCAAGSEPRVVCNGSQTQDTTCAACPAGKHKPSGAQKMCEVCPTGYYKSTITSANCVACNNSAGAAVYQAWGATLPSSNACPLICISGYYKLGAACVACNASAGRYSSVANVTGTIRVALAAAKSTGTESLGLSSVCVLHQQAQQQLLPTAAAGGPGVQRHDQRLPVVSLDAVRW